MPRVLSLEEMFHQMHKEKSTPTACCTPSQSSGLQSLEKIFEISPSNKHEFSHEPETKFEKGIKTGVCLCFYGIPFSAR